MPRYGHYEEIDASVVRNDHGDKIEDANENCYLTGVPVKVNTEVYPC